MMRFGYFFNVIVLLIPELFILVNSQILTTINFLDKSYENEPFYYDLSFLNSNFSNHESIQNKFSTRERNGLGTHKHSCNQIKQIPSSIRIDLKLSYFYQKYTEAYGIPIVGSNKVTINGLKRACYVLRHYLASSELRELFYKKNLRVVVLATSENILNVPEYNLLSSNYNSLRGLSPTLNIPLVTVSEENLLCSNDKFKAEDLMVHELSYGLLSLDILNPDTKHNLNIAYNQAKTTVPWKNTFALVDIKEYLASGIDAFLNSYGKREYFTFTLQDLKMYDPRLLHVIQSIFTCDNVYLNKCKSTRETESSQIMKLGSSCEVELSGLNPNTVRSTTTMSSTTQTEKPVHKFDIFRQVQNSIQTKPSTQTTTETTTTSTYSVTSAYSLLNKIFTSPPSTTTRTSTTTTQYLIKKQDCENLNENCESWALKGECNRNRQYMNLECKRSCGLCSETSTTKSNRKTDSTTRFDLSVFENLCKDEFQFCPVFALRGDCKLNPHYMLQKCMRSCNLCGDLVDQKDRIQPTSKKTIIRRPNSGATQPNYNPYSRDNTYNYYYTTIASTDDIPRYTVSIYQEPKTEPENDSACKDLVDYCSDLVERGDCITNEATMKYYCPVSCNVC